MSDETKPVSAEDRAKLCHAEVQAALERHVCRMAVVVREVDGTRQPPEVIVVSR